MNDIMLNEAEKLQHQADREALRLWLAGDRARPFILPRRKAYDVCTVLFPTLGSWLRFNLRFAWAFLIGKIPWSGVKIFFFRRMGMEIGRDIYIAPGVFLDPMFPQLMELEDGCFLGGECKLLNHEYTTEGFRIGKIRVGKESVIGAFSIVRSGTSIGDKVTTGLGCVVYRDVPDHQIVAGNPARYLRYTEEE
jgi:acetyltransferase-like isoleucine patch superfamily enzyme